MSIDYFVAAAIQLAMNQGVAGSADDLDIRYNIIPDFDLLDENKQTIQSRSWKQPVTHNYTSVETDTLIYGGINNSSPKVIVFSGVRALQKDVYATSIKFDSGAATIAVEGIQDLVSTSPGESFGQKSFERPYMFSDRMDCKIYLRANESGLNQQDKLLFMGFVVEQKGVHVVV